MATKPATKPATKATPAKPAAKPATPAKAAVPAKPKAAAIPRRHDPDEASNMAKVMKLVEKAGPSGLSQASIKTTLGTPFAGWFYLEKLADEGKVKLVTHKMRVYGTLPNVKFVAPADDKPAPKVKAAKPATPAKAAAKPATNGKAAPAGNGAKAAGKKPGKVTTTKPAPKSAAQQAADDLL